MTIDFGSLRRLILTSKHQLLNINKEIKDLKHEIEEELEGIQEFKEEVKEKERNIFEENAIEKDNGLVVNSEKGKDFCDVTLVCEDEQIYVHKLIFSFHCEECPVKFTLESDLKKHKWTHSETKTSSCTLCQKYFSHTPEWKGHMKGHMMKQSNFQMEFQFFQSMNKIMCFKYFKF